MTFLLASQNLPFGVAIGLMIALALVEMVTTLMGFGLSGVLDNLIGDADVDLDVDADADADVDMDVDAGAGFSMHGHTDVGGAEHIVGVTIWARVLGWLTIGRVPALVLLIAFLTSFGLIGYLAQGLTLKITGTLMPASWAAVPAFLLALPLTRRFGLMLAHLIPKDETQAVSRASFIGMVATVTMGTASRGNPAQAKFSDAFGQTHYVLVEPDLFDISYPQGTEVVLVTDLGSRFLAVEHVPKPEATAEPA
ncbi:MAG: YqiJ family protein [Magnetospiraceae bacterium]